MVLGNARLQTLAGDRGWLEGPVWFTDHQTLLSSDIPNDHILRGSPSGALLGKVFTPTAVSNPCFGGRERSRLCLCAGTQLLSVTVNRQGAQWP